jgi:hypothetical protein
MGLRQFLLILLIMIIVGVAAAVGVTQFGQGALIANRDALAHDCNTIISRSRIFYEKSLSQGGGGNTFVDVTFDKLGMASSSEAGQHANVHGAFKLTSTAQTVTCLGTGNEPVADGHDVQVRIVYFSIGDSTQYQDNMTGGELHDVTPLRAVASSSIFSD